MLFFGFYFLFAKTPEKKIFKNYLRSRQIMGIAMLLLSANYSVHFFFGIRFKNADSAILMNMSTYFLCYSLFSSALIMLLDRFYITKRRMWTHIILWIIFSTLSGVVLFLLPSGIMQKFSLFALAVWLVVFGVVLARRVIIAYRRAIRIFNETQADDIGAYIEWLSIFTYWALIFGVGCGLLTFLPDKYVFICNDFDKEEDNALISPNVALKFSVSDYIDHFNHYANMKPDDLSKESSIQKAAFLII